MIKIEKGILTEEQKRAFQKGDEYYVSPLKQYVREYHAVEFLAPTCAYTTTNYKRIYGAEKDRNKSRSWN